MEGLASVPAVRTSYQGVGTEAYMRVGRKQIRTQPWEGCIGWVGHPLLE